MIHTGDRKQPWLAGMEAARTTPSGNMKVYANWKSALYSSSFDARKVELVWAAGSFFKWLLDKLLDAGVTCDGTSRVRVTIPALKQIEEQQDALIQCMRLNGWPKNIEVVIEPIANIIGVLSAGKNVVSGYGEISYQPTFGTSEEGVPPKLHYVFEQIRRYALRTRTQRNMQISVVDFGSFTLDIANLGLDLSVIDHPTFPVNKNDANSWEIGIIKDIDNPCFDALSTYHGVSMDSLSFERKELAKHELYAGKEYALTEYDGHTTVGVSNEDRAMISGTIDAYCEKVWTRMQEHCHGPEVIALTGGGVCIKRIRDFFNNHRLPCVQTVIDFPNNASPELPDGLYAWQEAGGGLGRLATALGGASIGLGFTLDDFCKRAVPRGIQL